MYLVESTKKGQREFKRKYEEQAYNGLSPLDYTKQSKAMLCPVSPSDNDWYEIELTADTVPVIQPSPKTWRL